MDGSDTDAEAQRFTPVSGALFKHTRISGHFDNGQVDPVPRPRSRRQHRMPNRYESEHYDPLPTSRGAIRLLKLHSGSPDNPEIEGTLLPFDSDKGEKVPEYEALSWNWGPQAFTKYIGIRKGDNKFAKMIKPTLFHALKVLRYHAKDRYLWIDQICINQDFLEEKNHQVELMSEIYGKAKRVLVWLGKATERSQIALRFIHDEVLKLQDFDDLCNKQENSTKWLALLDLMQRAWFSRRWVVQEIALAKKAVLYCGEDKLSWDKFAVAVELFVEVETATHRLSEVMKKDPNFYHVPGWFEYVSALGASLLVDATGRLFRDDKGAAAPRSPTKLQYIQRYHDHLSDSEGDSDDDTSDGVKTNDNDHQRGSTTSVEGVRKEPWSRGQPLLGLEFLVTSLSIFEATVPHDTIYALLAIARDTTPVAVNTLENDPTPQAHKLLEVFTQRKTYPVDYKSDYLEVCKTFIQFCITESVTSDPTRSLDVLCRPWAMDEKTLDERRRWEIERLTQEINRQNDRDTEEKRRRLKEGADMAKFVGTGPERLQKMRDDIARLKAADSLPSWVPQLSGATYDMYAHPGVEGIKMGRMNADVLVGLPSLNQRNYTAAESKRVDTGVLSFRRRKREVAPESKQELSWENHYSMYVSGFELDTIVEVAQRSQNGAIPREWTDLGGWSDPSRDPLPDRFWRTLVADRGKDGRNPPVYYARACRECFEKGGLRGGAVDTSGLINNERNSIVAQFCRRVQAVIWNRALARTKGDKLALVGPNVEKGDKVCILYGCSVPVILREGGKKSANAVERELQLELQRVLENLATFVDRNRDRKAKLRTRKEKEKAVFRKWNEAKRMEWKADKEWRAAWSEQRKHELKHGIKVQRRRKCITEGLQNRKATQGLDSPWIVVKVTSVPERFGNTHLECTKGDVDRVNGTGLNGATGNKKQLDSAIDLQDPDHDGYSNSASYSRYTRDEVVLRSFVSQKERMLRIFKPEIRQPSMENADVASEADAKDPTGVVQKDDQVSPTHGQKAFTPSRPAAATRNSAQIPAEARKKGDTSARVPTRPVSGTERIESHGTKTWLAYLAHVLPWVGIEGSREFNAWKKQRAVEARLAHDTLLLLEHSTTLKADRDRWNEESNHLMKERNRSSTSADGRGGEARWAAKQTRLDMKHVRLDDETSRLESEQRDLEKKYQEAGVEMPSVNGERAKVPIPRVNGADSTGRAVTHNAHDLNSSPGTLQRKTDGVVETERVDRSTSPAVNKDAGWGPGVVNWREFELRLKYFRCWKRYIRKVRASRLQMVEELQVALKRSTLGPKVARRSSAADVEGPLTENIPQPLIERHHNFRIPVGRPNGRSTTDMSKDLHADAAGPAKEPHSHDKVNKAPTGTQPMQLSKQGLEIVDSAEYKVYPEDGYQEWYQALTPRLKATVDQLKRIQQFAYKQWYVDIVHEIEADGMFGKWFRSLSATLRDIVVNLEGSSDRVAYKEWYESLLDSMRQRRGTDVNYYYKFLGEAYIHSMMDGEAMAFQNGKNKDEKVIPPRVFELR